MKTKIVTITPEMAKEMVKMNVSNRNLSMRVAERYAASMKAGAWKLNHQGIAFYEDGTLADGQHRLLAIMLSGAPQEMMVFEGVEKDAALGIDCHRARKMADVVRIAGLSDWVGEKEIQVAKAMYMVTNCAPANLPANALVDLAEENRSAITFAVECWPTSKRFLTTAAVRAALAFAHPHEDEGRLREFSVVLYTGLPSSTLDGSALTVREHLLMGRNTHSGVTNSREVCFRVQRGIQAFCRGVKLRKLFAPKEAIYKNDSFQARAI